MRRRDFMAILGGAVAAWPLMARAQRNRHIGILHSGYPNRTPIQHLFSALRAPADEVPLSHRKSGGIGGSVVFMH